MMGFSIRSSKLPVVPLAVVLIAVAAVTMLQAQTALQTRLAARHLTQGEVAAYKLPAGTQLSAGLTTVGLGEPVYFEAQVASTIDASYIVNVTWLLSSRPAGSAAFLADSPLGANVPVFEPSERLVSRAAGRTLLRPDVAGPYVVTVTVFGSDGKTATDAQTVIAGKYVGISGCVKCHSGGLADVKTQAWSKTAHASIFKDGVNGVASDHYGSGCFSCHTVGYDTNANAVNGGFDDVARSLGWTLPSVLQLGTWDTVPDALKNVANIQCENCHGAGSQHAAHGGDTMEISVGTNTGACSKCHDAPTHHIKSGEWANSRHAIATRDPSGAGREGCVGCHTAAGFMGRVNQAKTVDTTYGAINCQTCHEPHGQTTPADNPHLVRALSAVKLADGTTVTGGGTGMLCMNCHQSRQNASVYAATAAASTRFGPHHGPQADMLEGVNGFDYGRILPSSAHAFAAKDTCVTCHMQTVDTADPGFTHVGGHTFLASYTAPGSSTPEDLVGACQGCHGPRLKSFNFTLFDYNGDGVIEGVQTEVQHLLDELSALLPPAGKPKTALTIDSSWTRAELEAGFNWQFVHDDGSLGIHNTAYAVSLLKASIADLQAHATH